MTHFEADVVSKLSPRSVADTVHRLTSLIAARNLTLFAVIDQRAAAATAGLDLRATTLVIFGSPAAGTAVMVAAPLAAVDLPLKVLIWDDGGQVSTEVMPVGERSRVVVADGGLAARLSGIGPLTDALVAP